MRVCVIRSWSRAENSPRGSFIYNPHPVKQRLLFGVFTLTLWAAAQVWFRCFWRLVRGYVTARFLPAATHECVCIRTKRTCNPDSLCVLFLPTRGNRLQLKQTLIIFQFFSVKWAKKFWESSWQEDKWSSRVSYEYAPSESEVYSCTLYYIFKIT